MKPTVFSVERTRYFKLLALLGMVIAAYAGAINRGESLLWVIGALLLAVMIVGFTWPHLLIRHLSVARTGPERAQEGETVIFRVEMTNQGWLPRFMIEVVDWLPFAGSAANAVKMGNRVLGIIAYASGGEQRSFEVSMVCEKRGYYQIGPVYLSTSFPLGLSEVRQRKQDSVQTLTIYPEMFQITKLSLRGTPSQINRGDFLLPEVAGTAEFCRLREYRHGDNPRHIHWATTARMNELMIREFEPLASASLCLTLDLVVDSNVGSGRHSTLEYAIKIAASMARHASKNGMPFRLAGDGVWPPITKAGTGETYFKDTLDKLAVIDSGDAMPYAQLLEDVARGCEPGETIVVFLSEPQARIETTLQAIALLRSHGTHVLAIVFNRHTFIDEGENLALIDDRIIAILIDMEVTVIQIRQGDDFTHLFI